VQVPLKSESPGLVSMSFEPSSNNNSALHCIASHQYNNINNKMSNVHGLFSNKKEEEESDDDDGTNERYVGGISSQGGGR
jgi:hypothetical protein